MPQRTDTPMSGIVLSGVTKHFKGMPGPALKNITAHITAGKITGLVGADGAGKTTLLRHMAALLHPSKGSLTVNGYDTVTQQPFIHQITGYMPQKFGLYEDLSVLENLTLYADIFGLSPEERTEQFKKLLHFTNLSPFQKRLAGRLSGGMKQKLGLACALLRHPQVLLLDEPSVGVDPISRRELWAIIKNMVADGTTVVWSTAYLEEAERCAEVLALHEGELIFKGPPQDLMKRVQGRVFESAPLDNNKRPFLQNLLEDPRVMDGLIKGPCLRVLLRTTNLSPLNKTTSLKWFPIEGNFEDGFIDLLGGIQERHSRIAALIDPISPLAGNKAPIQATSLTKKFGPFIAAQKISFEVKPGEVFGLLGPNGAGKSTTFKMLCGLLKPTDGQSSILGYDLRSGPALARQNIGYMAQKFSLYSNLTVQQNLEFFSGIYGLQGGQRGSAIKEMIETFNLKPYLKLPADSLSLGFKQRLALACAIMHRPKVLFLDEPTSGVDPLTRREFWLHINGMVQKGMTVLVTTHFMEEAEYCDRLCLIYQSEIIALGTPDALKKQAQGSNPSPLTLEQAFIKMIESHNAKWHTEKEKSYDI